MNPLSTVVIKSCFGGWPDSATIQNINDDMLSKIIRLYEELRLNWDVMNCSHRTSYRAFFGGFHSDFMALSSREVMSDILTSLLYYDSIAICDPLEEYLYPYYSKIEDIAPVKYINNTTVTSGLPFFLKSEAYYNPSNNDAKRSFEKMKLILMWFSKHSKLIESGYIELVSLPEVLLSEKHGIATSIRHDQKINSITEFLNNYGNELNVSGRIIGLNLSMNRPFASARDQLNFKTLRQLYYANAMLALSNKYRLIYAPSETRTRELLLKKLSYKLFALTQQTFGAEIMADARLAFSTSLTQEDLIAIRSYDSFESVRDFVRSRISQLEITKDIAENLQDIKIDLQDSFNKRVDLIRKDLKRDKLTGTTKTERKVVCSALVGWISSEVLQHLINNRSDPYISSLISLFTAFIPDLMIDRSDNKSMAHIKNSQAWVHLAQLS